MKDEGIKAEERFPYTLQPVSYAKAAVAAAAVSAYRPY